MGLEKKPFVKYNLSNDNKPDTFTIRLNEVERTFLNKCKIILEQPKDSTALKQLACIGANVLHDKITGRIIQSIFKNKTNNKRQGIIDFE